MKKVSFIPLVLFVLVTQMAGIVGGLFTAPAIESWYAGLIKPTLSPPNWIFAPVWTLLYLLMGVAAYLVWKENTKEKNDALFLFFTQLVLNSLWSILFFALKNPGLALFEIAILWSLILATLVKFLRIKKWAGYLLIPYLAWVSFATYLNFMIWRLN